MTISAKEIFSLRNRTGVSINLCKKALEEANGDQEKAIEILRSTGEAQAVKKADRDQGEGYIFAASTDTKAAVVLLRCETDFVARNDDFQAIGTNMAQAVLEQGKEATEASSAETINTAVQQLGENISLGSIEEMTGDTIGVYVHTNGKVGAVVVLTGGSEEIARDIAMHASAMRPDFLSPDEVSEEAVAKEKEIWTEQLKEEGKSAEIMEKIMLGKEKKFREENALLTQPFVKDPDQTIATLLGDATITSYKLVTV